MNQLKEINITAREVKDEEGASTWQFSGKAISSNSAYFLSGIITILATIAASGGLFAPFLYDDNDFIKISWRANDAITLFIAVPLLVAAMIRSRQGSNRWALVWMGLLLYMLYNYSFYLFGAMFNKFFLIYAALVSMSIYTLILGLSHLDVKAVAYKFNPKTPVKIIAVYLIITILPLLFIELYQCVQFLITEKTPSAPPLIFALDFVFVLPLSILAAVHLWNRHAWGYVLAVLALVKGFIYGLVLSAGAGLLSYSALFGNLDPLMPFYLLIAIGGFTCCFLLLKNLRES